MSSPKPSSDIRTEPSKGSAVARVDSRDLLAGQRQLIIVHAGQEYRLQVTSSGKLILTK